MTKRRLEDRRELIQDRWEKSINSLKLHFNNLLDLVNKKCDEIVEGYSNIFEKAIEEHMDVCHCSTAITITGINHATA